MKVLLKLTLCVFCFTAVVWADTLTEGFDNIATLSGAGWVQTNNSSPAGTSGWFQGNPLVFSSQSGAPDSYIAANFLNAAPGGNISNWLLTPVLSLSNGQVVSFFARTEVGGAIFNDSLELRLSTNGASTDVGATDTSLGDFTTLLLTINPTLNGSFPEGWTQFTVTLSGLSSGVTGRLAFRYNVTDTSFNGDYIGIDSVTVPEPGPLSAMLLATGLMGIALFRYKQRLV
jgi:hypothetical protein